MLLTSTSDPNVQNVIRDLWDTLNHLGAAGLAANQIGEPYKICVIKRDHLTLINPVVVSGHHRFPSVEGCYSIPGYRAIVPRYRQIKITARYPSTLTPFLRIIDDAELAVPIQHEIDHLNGILIMDYVEKNFERKGGSLISRFDPDYETAVSYKKQVDLAKK